MEKALRKQCNTQGVTLLLYKLIMNVVVTLVTVVMAMVSLTGRLSPEDDMQSILSKATEAVSSAATSGWGYLLTILLGIICLLVWKKPRYIRQELLKKGRPMALSSFFTVLCLFMGVQLLSQLGVALMHAIMRSFGKDLYAYMASTSVNTSDISMFLYVGLAAPLFEELVFRGLLMRSIEPYGQRLAIVLSALLFGLYHGNPVQTPYAFLVGLVLGYVAMEYNILWAMVLHMFNNLIFADTIPRLLMDLPARMADGIVYALMAIFTIVAVILLGIKQKQVVQQLIKDRLYRWQWRSVFTSPWMLILIGVCILEMALYVFMIFITT